MKKTIEKVDAKEIGVAIEALKTYVTEDISSLIAALEALKQEPENTAFIEKFLDVFNGLGITQGAVLTYAPYIIGLLSEDPFADH